MAILDSAEDLLGLLYSKKGDCEEYLAYNRYLLETGNWPDDLYLSFEGSADSIEDFFNQYPDENKDEYDIIEADKKHYFFK